MKRALIITARVDRLSRLQIDFADYDTIICADGGLLIAEQLNLVPDILIGDYDSAKQPAREDVIKLPMEKDMTDSEAAVDLAVSLGHEEITLLGGLGGRFDHTMGNIGILAKYCGRLHHLAIADGQNYVFMLSPGSVRIPRSSFPYLGLISYGDAVCGITLRGVKYPLTDFTLSNATTLGVSNEITEEEASVSFTGGRLLLVLSRDA